VHSPASTAPSARPHTTGWLIAILAVAAICRLAWVVLVPNVQYSDSVWYDAAAANLAAAGVYGPDAPSAWFPPGYPFLLAALYGFFGHSEMAGKLANVAIGVGMTGATYLLGRALVGEAVGLVGAALIAVWPNLVFHTGVLSSDLLAALGFVTVMWLGMRPRNSAVVVVLLGALIGWMVLVRPVGLILLAGLGLWWWVKTRSLVGAVVRLLPLVLITGAIVGAWTLRNYREFGEPIAIASNGGYNFWQTNHRYADGNDTFWPTVPMDDPEYQTMRNSDEFTKNREGYRYALAYLRAHPTHILTMLPTKLFWLYHSDTSGLYEGVLYPDMHQPSRVADWVVEHERVAEAFTFRYYEAVLLLAVVGATLTLFRRRPAWIWPILALPFLLTFFHLFFHAKDRFHIPLDGIFALLAATSIVEGLKLAGRLGRYGGRSRGSAVASVSRLG
jgi:4-amino-4-deoxy-L-arabinose transferase-like glycosyltransferase